LKVTYVTDLLKLLAKHSFTMNGAQALGEAEGSGSKQLAAKNNDTFGYKCVLLLLAGMNFNKIGLVDGAIHENKENAMDPRNAMDPNTLLKTIDAFKQHPLLAEFPECCAKGDNNSTTPGGSFYVLHEELKRLMTPNGHMAGNPLVGILLLAWSTLLKRSDELLGEAGHRDELQAAHQDAHDLLGEADELWALTFASSGEPWQKLDQLIADAVPDRTALVLPLVEEVLPTIEHGGAQDVYIYIVREVVQEMFHAYGEHFQGSINGSEHPEPLVRIFTSPVTKLFERYPAHDGCKTLNSEVLESVGIGEDAHPLSKAIKMAEGVFAEQLIPLLELISALATTRQGAELAMEYLERTNVQTRAKGQDQFAPSWCVVGDFQPDGAHEIALKLEYRLGSIVLPAGIRGMVNKQEQVVTWDYSLLSAIKNKLHLIVFRVTKDALGVDSLSAREVEEACCITELLSNVLLQNGPVITSHFAPPAAWQSTASHLSPEERGLAELCSHLNTMLHASSLITLQRCETRLQPQAFMIHFIVQVAANAGCLMLLSADTHETLSPNSSHTPRKAGFLRAAELMRELNLSHLVLEEATKACAERGGSARDIMLVAAAVAAAITLLCRTSALTAGQSAADATKNAGRGILEVAQTAEAAAGAVALVTKIGTMPSERDASDAKTVNEAADSQSTVLWPHFAARVVATAHVANAFLTHSPGAHSNELLLLEERMLDLGTFQPFSKSFDAYKSMVLRPPLGHESYRSKVLLPQFYVQTCAAAVGIRNETLRAHTNFTHKTCSSCFSALSALIAYGSSEAASTVVRLMLNEELDSGVFHDLTKILHEFEQRTGNYMTTLTGVRLLSAMLPFALHMQDERADRLTERSVDFALHILRSCDAWTYTTRIHQWQLKYGALSLLRKVTKLSGTGIQASLIETCLSDLSVVAAIHRAAGWLGASAMKSTTQEGGAWTMRPGRDLQSMWKEFERTLEKQKAAAGKQEGGADDAVAVDFLQGVLGEAEYFEDVLVEHVTMSALQLIENILTAGGVSHLSQKKVAMVMRPIELSGTVLPHITTTVDMSKGKWLTHRTLVNAIASYSYYPAETVREIDQQAVQVLVLLSRCISCTHKLPSYDPSQNCSIVAFLGPYKAQFQKALIGHLKSAPSDEFEHMEPEEQAHEQACLRAKHIAVLQLAATALDTQRELAALLLGLDENGAAGAESELFQCLMNTVADQHSVLLDKDPALFSATLGFVSALCEGCTKDRPQHKSAWNAFLKQLNDKNKKSDFWTHLVNSLVEPLVLPEHSNGHRVWYLEKHFLSAGKDEQAGTDEQRLHEVEKVVIQPPLPTGELSGRLAFLEERAPIGADPITADINRYTDGALLPPPPPVLLHQYAVRSWCLRIIELQWYHFKITPDHALFIALKAVCTDVSNISTWYGQFTKFGYKSVKTELTAACKQCGLELDDLDRFRRPDDDEVLVLQAQQPAQCFYDIKFMETMLTGLVATLPRTKWPTLPALQDRQELVRVVANVNVKISFARAQLTVLQHWHMFVTTCFLAPPKELQLQSGGVGGGGTHAPLSKRVIDDPPALGDGTALKLLKELVEVNLTKLNLHMDDKLVLSAIGAAHATQAGVLVTAKEQGQSHALVSLLDATMPQCDCAHQCAELLALFDHAFDMLLGSFTTTSAEARPMLALQVTLWASVVVVLCQLETIFDRSIRSGHLPPLSEHHQHILPRLLGHSCSCLRLRRVLNQFDRQTNDLFMTCSAAFSSLARLRRVATQVNHETANAAQQIADAAQTFGHFDNAFANASFLEQLVRQNAINTLLVALVRASEEATNMAAIVEGGATTGTGIESAVADMDIDVVLTGADGNQPIWAVKHATTGGGDAHQPHQPPMASNDGPHARASVRLDTVNELLIVIAQSGGDGDGLSAGELIKQGVLPAICSSKSLQWLLHRAKTALGAGTIFDLKRGKQLSAQELRRWWGYTVSNEKSEKSKPLGSRGAGRCRLHSYWCTTLQLVTVILRGLGPNLEYLPRADGDFEKAKRTLGDQVESFLSLCWPLLTNALRVRTETLAGLKETEAVMALVSTLCGTGDGVSWWQTLSPPPQYFKKLTALVGPKVSHLTLLLGTGRETKTCDWPLISDAHVSHNRWWVKVVRPISAEERDHNRADVHAEDYDDGDEQLARVIKSNLSFIRSAEGACTKALRYAIEVLIKLTPSVVVLDGDIEAHRPILELLPSTPGLEQTFGQLLEETVLHEDISRLSWQGQEAMCVGHLVILLHYCFNRALAWQGQADRKCDARGEAKTDAHPANRPLQQLLELNVSLLTSNLVLHEMCYDYNNGDGVKQFKQFVSDLRSALVGPAHDPDPTPPPIPLSDAAQKTTEHYPLLAKMKGTAGTVQIRPPLDQYLIDNAIDAVANFGN
jgi:hypothetical protein